MYSRASSAIRTLPGESQIDELAAKIGKDPYQFRLDNAAKPGEEFFPGMRPFDGTLKQDLDTAAKAIGWGTPLDYLTLCAATFSDSVTSSS